ncbi:hypothetical protein NN561_020053 [Cricetulus griseus]
MPPHLSPGRPRFRVSAPRPICCTGSGAQVGPEKTSRKAQPRPMDETCQYPGYASPISSMDFGLLFFLSVLLRAVSSAHPPVTVTVNGGSSLKVSFRVLWSQWWKANSSNVLMSSSSAFGWLAAHRGENLSGSIEATPTAYGESHGSSNWPLASHLAAMEFWKILSSVVGGIVALCIGLLTSVYLATLHENDLWFSNIKKYLEPVYFYIYTLFGLQAVYVAALYMTSWLLSGTWLSGLLAALWYVTNRTDTTRVEFTIPLRENWALPFFAIQIAAITYFLRPNLQPLSELQQIWSTWSLHQKQQLPLVLVGNKCDLVMTSGDAHTAAANVAHKWGVPFVKTSAKTQQGVEEAFALIVHEIQRAQEAVAEPSMEKTQPHEATCRCGCSVA